MTLAFSHPGYYSDKVRNTNAFALAHKIVRPLYMVSDFYQLIEFKQVLLVY